MIHSKLLSYLTLSLVCLTSFYKCQINEAPHLERSKTEIENFSNEQLIVSQDIDNFWKAYDAIREEPSEKLKRQHLKSIFLDQASKGQKKMMESRNYTAEDYLTSIENYPQFWNSLRKNTGNLLPFNNELRNGLTKLVHLYPSLRKSKIFYTMGTHRSPGTGIDNLVMIGSEFALGDSTTITNELPNHLQNYYEINPTNHLELLIVHEYVHTQQKEMVHDLLSLALYEGIAEFVATTATQRKSPFKAFKYGPRNKQKIVSQFERDLFNPKSIFNWLWNSPNNEFGTRDLGYFIGHSIAKSFYECADNKKEAIRILIELDYHDREAVEDLVDATQIFSAPIQELRKAYNSKQPWVTSIKEFENGERKVNPDLKIITLNFSEPMDKDSRGFDYGPLGEPNVLSVEKIIGYSEDGMSFSYEVVLEADKRYQVLISDKFISRKGERLKPYLIDIRTATK